MDPKFIPPSDFDPAPEPGEGLAQPDRVPSSPERSTLRFSSVGDQNPRPAAGSPKLAAGGPKPAAGGPRPAAGGSRSAGSGSRSAGSAPGKNPSGIRQGKTRSASPSGKITRYRLTMVLLALLGVLLLAGLVFLLVKLLTPPAVERVVIRGAVEQLVRGDTAKLSAVIYPEEAESDLHWSSSDPEVASVDSAGNLTPLKNGECTITAEAGGKTDSFPLRVLAVSSVEIEETDDMLKDAEGRVMLCVGETMDLRALLQPAALADRPVSWSSSGSNASVDEHGKVTALGSGTCTITASAGDVAESRESGTASVQFRLYEIASVTIRQKPKELLVGKTAQLEAKIDSPEAARIPVVWTSSNPEFASVDENGLVTSVATGTATISVSAGGKTDSFLLQTFRVSSIEIRAGSREITVGETARLSAAISPAESADIPVTWTSSDPDVATVSAEGLVTPVSHGQCRITAEADGKTAEVLFTVYEVTAIHINQPANSIVVGEQTRMSATIEPESALGTTPIEWRSSDPAVAIINSSSGELTPVAAGRCMITATAGSRSDSLVCVVYEVETVTVDETEDVLYVGDVVELSASISPEEAAGAKVTWRSSDQNVLSVDPGTGQVTACSSGTCTITASAGYKTGMKRFTIYEVTSVTIDAMEEPVFYIGEPVSLSVTIQPLEASGAKVTWTSSDPSILTIDEDGVVTPLRNGTVSITAQAGLRTDVVNYTVLTVSGVTITGGNRETCIDESVSLEAVLQPAQAAGFPVTWTSSNPEVAVVDEHGVVTPVRPGSCTITATAETKSDSVVINVQKYNRAEKKIFGTWAYKDGLISSLFGTTMYMTLNSGLTGTLTSSDLSKTFTWSYSSQSGSSIRYSVSGIDNAYMIYNESAGTLTLYVTGSDGTTEMEFHRYN